MDKEEIILQPGMGARHYWLDIWRYRELFYFLAWRDILVRYKQTVIGIAWSVMRPVLTMLAFTVLFGNLARLPSNGIPYPIMVFAALLPWQFFSNSLNEGSSSLIDNANLLTKVYFPRLIVPASNLLVNSVDFCLSFAVLCVLSAWYHFIPGPAIVLLPVFFLLALMTSFGFGLWFSALNVRYRDFRYVVPFTVQFGLFISPVGFSSSIVPLKWKPLFYLNPMAGVIDGFRRAILGDAFPLYWPGMLISLLVTVSVLVSGLLYFRNTERSFADMV